MLLEIFTGREACATGVFLRKNFPLRIDAELFDAVKRWADDELRSANGQIEFLLRKALKQAGRLPKSGGRGELSEEPQANHPGEIPSEGM